MNPLHAAALLARRFASNVCPASVRSFILRRVSLLDARTAWWVSRDPYREDPPRSTYASPYPVRLGIARELWHRHAPYIAACRDLRVSYEVVDLNGADWLKRFQSSKCDAYLVWPSVQLQLWKQLCDERLRILEEVFAAIVFPTCRETWFYESKRRMHYWLAANGIPHPRTWVFYDMAEALRFAADAALPIVAKTNIGARASGVRILDTRTQLVRYLHKAFGRGILHGDGEAREREWGCAILQEYIADAKEWRVLRLGDSYFAHQKLKEGRFHSGSGRVSWAEPPPALLDFARNLTTRHRFTSMDLDIFETSDGGYLVNELQTMFSSIRPYQMLVKGVPGRYVYDEVSGAWRFERGFFCHNACCNLRVATVMRSLGYEISLPTETGEVLAEDLR